MAPRGDPGNPRSPTNPEARRRPAGAAAGGFAGYCENMYSFDDWRRWLRARFHPVAVLCLVGWIGGGPTAEAATDAQLVAALTEFNEGAVYTLPVLTPAHRKRLLAGEVVKVVDMAPDGSGSRRAMGMIHTSLSRDAMWASCQDLHFVQSSTVHEHRLKSPHADKLRWYLSLIHI